MNQKINVGLICGGKSTEHEVSIKSAHNVYQALDKEKYNVTSIFIAFLLLFGVVIIIYLIMVIKVMGKER